MRARFPLSVPVSLASPSHRAALRFLRGGLVATVALLIPSQIGLASRETPGVAPLIALARVGIPAIGFAIGGAVGGSALGKGRRGAVACGSGLFFTGIVLSFTARPIQGLTGFEDARTVILFAAGATAAAFALGGAVAALLFAFRRTAMICAGFAIGGAVGGIVTVLPAVLAAPLGAWPADARLFIRLACSLIGLLAPFAVGGAVAGKAAGAENELETEN
jgi:hypothetical protein